MKEHFIVSFAPGTSGRFISGLLWVMLHNNIQHIPFTEFNSSHLYNEYKHSWDFSTALNIQSSDIYSKFKFLAGADIGVFNSHTYPDFSSIETHIPNSKLIIISFTETDITEIAGNNLFKNALPFARECIESGITLSQNHDLSYFLRLYRVVFGTSFRGEEHSLNDDDVYKLCNAWSILIKNNYRNFINPTIPESMKEKTLVLPYKNLYTKDENNYVGLTKLAAFINRTPDKYAIDSYFRYINGRNVLLKEKLPWITS